MPDRPHICVFCGSSTGARPSYTEAARLVGTTLAQSGLGLVYGGGRVGLMGAVADAALAAGGRVVGVIPTPLATREIAHDGLTDLRVVPGMHERKALMASLSAGFLTLPGGVGTFEELFEVITWSVLGLHRKPIGLLNVDGYFDPLLALLTHALSEHFLRPPDLDMLLISPDPVALTTGLLTQSPPEINPTGLPPSRL